ncbi:uncharacterized protein MONBRDRAFT_24405 [Monosiga brevicollis MX1]|uniref:Uncharacterized protein n=1 Tax=Monosiga brevicollis TaxID=81824 RepID=A9UWB8_MONBE|nr:uncharacterized protein MONBRDRAFT_24405 [Monosiga brevicollis MX1]EDQ90535.1 predicted protein [Monosiga brevicollis MX1]|eukprot:XP_001744586.1 hypothetical protein [Monosiga brevicollis MX1]
MGAFPSCCCPERKVAKNPLLTHSKPHPQYNGQSLHTPQERSLSTTRHHRDQGTHENNGNNNILATRPTTSRSSCSSKSTPAPDNVPAQQNGSTTLSFRDTNEQDNANAPDVPANTAPQPKTWPRKGTADLIWSKRQQQPTQRIQCANDITFGQWAATNQWRQFQVSHYDWWMFPWLAHSSDSMRSQEYSVRSGDMYDLIMRPEFVPNVAASVRHLVAANEHGFNPVTANTVHPARRSKIVGSLAFMHKVALASDQPLSLTTQLVESRELIENTFGVVSDVYWAEHIDYPPT